MSRTGASLALCLVLLFSLAQVGPIAAQTQNDMGSGGDAGNSFSAATLISAGSGTGYMDSTDGYDYYKISVSSGDTVSVTLTSPSGTDFDLTLYDASQYYLDSSYLTTSTDSVDGTATSSGYFYIMVDHYSGSGTYSMTVTVSAGTTTAMSKTFYFYDSSTYNYISNKSIYWGTSSASVTNYLGYTDSYGMITTTFSYTGQTIYFETGDATYSGSGYVSSYYTSDYIYLTSTSTTKTFYFYDSSTYNYISSSYIYWGTSSGSEYNYLGQTDSYGKISTTFSQTGTIYFVAKDSSYTKTHSGSDYIDSYSTYEYVYLSSATTSMTFYFYDSSTYNYISNKSIYWGTSSGYETNYLGYTDSYGKITTTFSYTGQTIYFETGDGTYSGSDWISSYYTTEYVYLTSTSASKTFYFYDSSTYNYISSSYIYWGTSSTSMPNYLGYTDSYGKITTTFSQTGTIYFKTSDGTYTGSDYIDSYSTYEYVYLSSATTSMTFYFYDSSTYNYISNKSIYWGTSSGSVNSYLGYTDSYGKISTTFSYTGQTIYFETGDNTYSGSDWVSSYYTTEYVYLTSTSTSKTFYFYDSTTYNYIANKYIYWGTSSGSETNYLGYTDSYGTITTNFSYTGQTIYFATSDGTYTGSDWVSSYYTYEYVYLSSATTSMTFYFYDSSTYNYISNKSIYWGTSSGSVNSYLGYTDSYGKISTTFSYTGQTIYFETGDNTYSGSDWISSYYTTEYVYLSSTSTSKTFYFYDSSTYNYIANKYIYWGTSSSYVPNYLGYTDSYGTITTNFSYTGQTIYFETSDGAYTGSDWISSYSTYEYVYLASSTTSKTFYFYDSSTYSAIANKSIYWGTSSGTVNSYLGYTDSYGKISTTFSYTGQTIYFETGDNTYSGSDWISSYYTYEYIYLTSTTTSKTFYFYDSSTYDYISNKYIYWGTWSGSETNYLGYTDSYGSITTNFSYTGQTIYFATSDGAYTGSDWISSYSTYEYVYLTPEATSKVFYFYDSSTYSAIANKSIYWGTSSGTVNTYLGYTDSYGKISTTFSYAGQTIYFETGDNAYTGSSWISSYYTYEYVYLTSTSTSKTFYFYDSTTYSALTSSYIYWGTSLGSETNYLDQTDSYGSITTNFSQTGTTIYFKAYDSSYNLTHSGSDWISSYYTYEYVYLTPEATSKVFYFYDSSTYSALTGKYIYWGTSSGTVNTYLGYTSSSGSITTTFSYAGQTIYFETGDNAYTGSSWISSYYTYEYVYLTSTSTSKVFYFYDSTTYDYISNSYIYWGTSSSSVTNYLDTTDSYGSITTNFSQTGTTIYFKAYDSSYNLTHSGSDWISSYYTYEYVYLQSEQTTITFTFYDSSTWNYITSSYIYWGTSENNEYNYLGQTNSYGQITTTFTQTGTIYFKAYDSSYDVTHSGSAYVYSWSSNVYAYLQPVTTTISFTFYDSSTWNYISSSYIYWGTSSGSVNSYLGTTNSSGQISTTFSYTGTIYFKAYDSSYTLTHSGNATIYSWTTSTWVSMVTTGVGGAQNDMGTGDDAGDSLSAATAVAAGTGTGEITSTDTEDYYKVYLTSGQSISVSMTPPSGADFDLYLYNSSQSQVDSSIHGGATTDSVTSSTTSAGYFYVRVKRYSGTGTYSMTITVSGGTTQNDFGTGGDAGDSPSAASTVAEGTGTGYLGGTDTNDYYKVSVSSGDTVSVDMTPPSGADFDLYLYNSSQATVDSSTYGGATTESVEGTVTSAGYFYIQVKKYSGSGTYSMTIDITSAATQNDMGTGTDAGNSLSAATTVAEGSGTGYLDSTDTNDYFKIYLTSGQGITASMTPPSGADFDLYLYNSSQTQVDSSTYGGATTDTVEDNAESSGYFYIRVKKYSGYGTYSMTITISEENVLAESPHNYTNNYDHTWAITGPSGTDNMRIHFSQIDVESYYDYVYIYDENWNFIEQYTGSHRDIWTSWVAGGSIKVRLVTDYSITDYGFVVDEMETSTYVAPPVTTTNKVAVIVGINNYHYINDLSYCVNDANDWKTYLVGQGYTVSSFLTDSQATESNIRSAITTAISEAGSTGTLAIILSGHGTNSAPDGSTAYCAYDARYSNTGYYTDSELQSDLSGYAGRLFVFFDSCHSGGMDEAVNNAGTNKTNRYMTTTCTVNGYGWDESSYQNGAWTYWYLEKGLIQQGNTTAEGAFTYASTHYPYSGVHAPQEFDGNLTSTFNMDP